MNCLGKSGACPLKVALLVIVFLAVLSIEIWPFPYLFPYLFYLRVPLIVGALLLALPAICLLWLPSMLGNLFALSSKWHLALVIVMAFLAALAAVILAGVIANDAPLRFADLPQGGVDWLRKDAFLTLVLPVLLAFPSCWAAYQFSQHDMDGQSRILGLRLGVAGAAIILAAVRWLPVSDEFSGLVEGWVVAVLSALPMIAPGHGYIEGQHLAYGHLAAVMFFLVAGLIGAAAFFLFRPSADPNRQREAPALFYLLELVLIVVCGFSLLTFTLDYFRLPSLLLFAGFSALVYRLCGVDHYYWLKLGQGPKQNPGQKPAPRQLCDSMVALDNRLQYQGKDGRTLVVVCASGGGIQASGWTSRVLTGLQEEIGKDFTRAIGLISAVSGGSVGSLYFLDRFTPDGYADPAQLRQIFDSATTDSLGATGWGLCYPDLWRFAGLPFLTARPRDRGAAIDLKWKSAMANPGATLDGWAQKVLAGELPIPVFNATIVEDGRAYQLAPVSMHGDSNRIVDFNHVFPAYDVDASTAALLSATFPYVTPITRNSNPACDPSLPVFHVADGGYFDNFGVVSAVNWLDHVLAAQAPDPKIERVLFIEIDAFHEDPPALPTEADSEPAGWLMAVLGPALALANVRDSSQAQRNKKDVESLREKWDGKGVRIERFKVAFPENINFYDVSLLGGSQGMTKNLASKLQQSVMQKKAYDPPLSWKLTKQQKQAIDLAWNGMVHGPVVQAIKAAWHTCPASRL